MDKLHEFFFKEKITSPYTWTETHTYQDYINLCRLYRQDIKYEESDIFKWSVHYNNIRALIGLPEAICFEWKSDGNRI